MALCDYKVLLLPFFFWVLQLVRKIQNITYYYYNYYSYFIERKGDQRSSYLAQDHTAKKWDSILIFKLGTACGVYRIILPLSQLSGKALNDSLPAFLRPCVTFLREEAPCSTLHCVHTRLHFELWPNIANQPLTIKRGCGCSLFGKKFK